MFSIGELSKRTKVKVPTIRSGLERLSFIRHARDLGFSIEAISSLIELQDHPDRSCEAASDIATSQLADVRAKIKRLRTLEKELSRISKGCDGEGVSEGCYILASLANHELCGREH